MSNENETKKAPEVAEQPQPTSPSADDIIKLTKDYVRKEEVEKIKAERDKAIEDRNKVYASVLDGERLQRQAEKKPLSELKKAYHEVIHKDGATNLEVVTAQMALRDALVEAGEPDPFAPSNPTPEDLAAAKRVADVKRECILEAEGDPKKFLYLFEQRIAPDDPALLNAIKKRKSKK